MKNDDEELEKYILSHNGEIADSFTKNVSILVVPALGVESEKVKKAKKYNIPIIPINDVKSYINSNYSFIQSNYTILFWININIRVNFYYNPN